MTPNQKYIKMHTYPTYGFHTLLIASPFLGIDRETQSLMKRAARLRLAEVSSNLSAVRKRHLTSNKQRLKCRVVAQSSSSLERTAPLGRAELTVG